MSLAQGSNTKTRPRIESGSPEPESNALITRPVPPPPSPGVGMIAHLCFSERQNQSTEIGIPELNPVVTVVPSLLSIICDMAKPTKELLNPAKVIFQPVFAVS